jgi:glycosyltransferase involved in cell wall biosynthesis
MKILLVSLFLPEIRGTTAGTRLVGEMLRDLSRVHEIHLATRVDEAQIDKVEDIRGFCKKVYLFPYPSIQKRSWLTLIRLMASYLSFSYRVNQIVDSGDFDIIQVEWVESGIFLKRKKVPMILDAHDIITKPAERYFKKSRGIISLLLYMRFLLTRVLEKYILKKFDKVFTRSEHDRDYLCSMGVQINVGVLPHPAGLDFIGRKFEREENTVMFLGSYKNHPSNVESVLYFYNSILPLIKSKISSVKFYVVGYGPTKEMMDFLGQDKEAVITGYVDDIESYYKKVMVFVAPMLTGGGVIAKILDAMLAGTPVVSTSIGNEGIGGIDSVHLLIADTPNDFADKVVRLLTDKELWLRFSNESRGFVLEKSSVGVIKDILNKTYDELIARSSYSS